MLFDSANRVQNSRLKICTRVTVVCSILQIDMLIPSAGDQLQQGLLGHSNYITLTFISRTVSLQKFTATPLIRKSLTELEIYHNDNSYHFKHTDQKHQKFKSLVNI